VREVRPHLEHGGNTIADDQAHSAAGQLHQGHAAMIRTGFSFKRAFGHLGDVHQRILECGYPAAPIADTANTFGWVKWSKLCAKAGNKPVFGVELAVVPNTADKKPPIDWWTFLAIDAVRPVNELIKLATRSGSREPCLTYDEATAATGVFKIAGHAARLELFAPAPDLFIGLSPAVSKGYFHQAKAHGHSFIARSENFYPTTDQQELYRVALGALRSSTQTYPLHILTDDEWVTALQWVAHGQERDEALVNRDRVLAMCNAQLVKAELLKPEKLMSLREMCVVGAAKLGCDLNNEVYAERLDKELRLIAEKEFEDYFYILADMINWAKERMIVGPARGSSCGSLVCYLLGITAIDPIPFGLIFERFIDINRKDLPDIDVDFSDVRRDMVFEYAEAKYGSAHVARLGTVGLFRPASALNQVGISLAIPNWMIDRTLESVTERSSGDSRAMQALEDAMQSSEAGRNLVREYPQSLLAAKMEGHPNNASQHAAGVIITQQPIVEYIGVDSRVNAAQCDKKDAEELNLLKIDALGLTQLSIFERTLQLIGKPDVTGYLETIPLDDPKAFQVLNDGKFSGIFQFTGQALKSLTKQVKIEKLDDMVSITALARPGPMATGGAGAWVKRRNGTEPVTTAHPMLTELTRDTYGVVVFQETVMNVVREMGNFSWEDTSAIRKAMSGRLGDEFFEKYWKSFLAGAEKNGVSATDAKKVWDQICTMGCLAGDTAILNPFKNQNQTDFTIKELAGCGGLALGRPAWPHGHRRRKLRRHKILSLHNDNKIKPSEIQDAYYSGRKETFELKVDSGETIRATAMHRFLTKRGWVSLSALAIGDLILMQGTTASTDRKKKKGTGSGAHNWVNKEGPRYSSQTRKLKAMFKVCQRCKKKPYQETHHIDGDHENHEWENLLPVCRSCHKQLHLKMSGRLPAPYDKGKSPRCAAVVSIGNPKMEDVYDIAMPIENQNYLANGFVVHNSWAFNKSHAVAYGIVSYWTCWLKAYHPHEFAAATLDAESNPLNQIQLLRELKEEGLDYVPVDPHASTDKWSFMERDGKKTLVGPLNMIKGIGPKMCAEILDCRRRGEPVRSALLKRIENGKTPIDSLYPIADAINRLVPDLRAINIITKPTRVKDVQCGIRHRVVILAVVKKIAPKDENETINVLKRQQRAQARGMVAKNDGVLAGPSQALNIFFNDDSDEIFCKVDRFDFERIGRPIIERGLVGKALYAIKGTVPEDFRMINVEMVKFLGTIDENPVNKDTGFRNYQISVGADP
jgi:DNA polymerase III alpha subunit